MEREFELFRERIATKRKRMATTWNWYKVGFVVMFVLTIISVAMYIEILRRVLYHPEELPPMLKELYEAVLVFLKK